MFDLIEQHKIEHRLAERHAHLLDLVEGRLCCSTRSNSAVFMVWVDDADGHSRSAICSNSQRWPRSAVAILGLAAVGVAVEEAAVLGGEEFLGGEELLLGEQRRHQARQRAAALMEFHRRRAPGGERAGRLASGEAERLAPWSRCRTRAAGRPPRPHRTARARPGRASRARGTPGSRCRCPIRVITSMPAISATSRSRPDCCRARRSPARAAPPRA